MHSKCRSALRGRGQCLCSGEVSGASREEVCMVQCDVPISTQTPGRLAALVERSSRRLVCMTEFEARARV